MHELKAAWSWRESRGLFSEAGAIRVFHGPGEGSGDLSRASIDLFVMASGGTRHAWVTQWGDLSPLAMKKVREFLEEKNVASAVTLQRPERGLPEEPTLVFGAAPKGRFVVSENGMRFLISLEKSRHPGLFLDHAPLRLWLKSRMKGLKVLNAFAYTGSLSVAAGLGQAGQVTTLDLSRPAIEWAQANWAENQLSTDLVEGVAADVFQWMPKAAREGRRFDCVILDPPSFARGKKGGEFSTQKDLARLHGIAMGLVAEGGYLVTSINSANVSRAKYEAEIETAARETRTNWRILSLIDLPETFPTPLGAREERYLKGWILQKEARS